jgi:hypothetical protein
MVKDQPAGAKGAPVLAVGGKGRGITQGFPQELWINIVGYRPEADIHELSENGFSLKRART